MRTFFAAAAALILSATVVTAQQLPLPVPPPFEHPGTPDSQPKCTKEYVASLKEQRQVLLQLKETAPEQIAAVCDGMQRLEGFARNAAKLMGKPEDEYIKLFEGAIGDMGRPFGIPRLDVRFLKHMCAQAEGETSRLFVTQLGQIKAEIERCSGV